MECICARDGKLVCSLQPEEMVEDGEKVYEDPVVVGLNYANCWVIVDRTPLDFKDVTISSFTGFYRQVDNVTKRRQ